MENFITRLTVTLAALMGVCSISGQTDTCKRCQRLMNRNEGYIATAMDKGFDFGPSVKADFAWAATVGSTRDVPEGTTCSANRFGARPDTTHLSTKAIQKAIDACARRGGGTVTLLPGSYLTGALYVRSGVNLHLDAGVKLVASRRLDDFPDIDTRVAGIEMRWPSAVINILDAQGAAVTGSGTIDCRGEWCWNRYWAMRPGYERQGLRWAVDYDCKRVRGILVQRSEDVTLRGFTLLRTGFWGCQMLYSSHCTADGLTIDNNMGRPRPQHRRHRHRLVGPHAGGELLHRLQRRRHLPEGGARLGRPAREPALRICGRKGLHVTARRRADCLWQRDIGLDTQHTGLQQ
jgi:hypothetical protein